MGLILSVNGGGVGVLKHGIARCAVAVWGMMKAGVCVGSGGDGGV
jgi:hypothetical protein